MENQIIKTLLEKRYSFNELARKLSCNRNSLRKQLSSLQRKGFVHTSSEGQKLFFNITIKGKNYYRNKTVIKLNADFTRLQKILEKTSKPEAIYILRNKAAFHPTEKEFEVGCIEAERIKEMSEHKEKVLAPLNHLFLEFAKIILKAEGHIGFREDLEGVEWCFRNGKAHWGVIPPDKSFYSPNNRF